MGSPFASAFASVTSCGLTPSCSQAKNVPVRPTPGLHLVEREQRAELVGERRRGRDEGRLERDDAALAEHRLEEHEPDVVAGARRRGRRRRSEPRSAPGRAARMPPASPAGP